jgi:very-short-patch-repair endonuclease
MKRSRYTARTAPLRQARRTRVERLAAQQDGVVSRVQIYATGMTRQEVIANVCAGRWQTNGSQSVVTYTGPVTFASRLWAAVFEAGPRAFLDGVAAVQAAGLERFDQPTIRVSVPRGARVRRARGVDVRQTRRWAAGDLAAGTGPPRSRCETAAIRGALWARSDKQAALLLSMAVQQGLVTADRLGVELLRVKRDKRRMFVNAVLLDLLGGSRSLGEIDFALECRRRGLPEPTRQAVRKSRDGRYFLDVVWEKWLVAVEIDGIQHTWAENVVQEALRQNSITLGDCRVLRLPLLGLRVSPDAFFAQIEQALRVAGWAATA